MDVLLSHWGLVFSPFSSLKTTFRVSLYRTLSEFSSLALQIFQNNHYFFFWWATVSIVNIFFYENNRRYFFSKLEKWMHSSEILDNILLLWFQ